MSHTKPAHPPTDETPEDRRFIGINWKVCAAARLCFALLVVGAALGLFGRGPLATVRAEAGGIALEHERFVREQGRFAVSLVPDSDTVTIVLRGITDQRDKVECVPEPESESIGGSVRTLVVPVEPGREAAIEIRWKPHDPGVHRGSVEVQGRAFEVWAMAYP